MESVTIEDLRKVIALNDLPEEHLKWILEHSELRQYEDGEVMVKAGEPVDYMWMMLEGVGSFYMDVNGRQVYYYDFDNSPETGGIGGLMPYSRLKTSPGYAYAQGRVRILGLHKKHFIELENLNRDFIQRLIALMTDRARYFATQQLQHEKVNALGKLAAGIAHEMNNPAAAINRISSELNRRLMLNFDLTRKLLVHGVLPEHVDTMQQMVAMKAVPDKWQPKITALRRMELEDEFSDWFTRHGIEKNTELSETFTAAGVKISELEHFYSLVGEKPFGDVILWLENLLSSHKIITDLDHASARISDLVGAIKSHVHMDKTNDVQPTQVITDIENTLTLLGHKLREKNIEVERKYAEPVPEVNAFVGELNQVWMNVIDNAIYAMDKNGKLLLEVFTRNHDVKVNITDNGAGIPEKILPRIFDPFFTTKKQGQGTGIGLDLVARIIKRHNGDIKVNSMPGRTTFSLCIPINDQKQQVNHIQS
jgi:signal transduction histidine kinase